MGLVFANFINCHLLGIYQTICAVRSTLPVKYNQLITLIMTVGVKNIKKYYIGFAFIHELWWMHFSYTEIIKLI